MFKVIDESRNLRKQVYQRIKEAIVNHKLYPGMKLDENELSEMLGVSRTPVRESFARLDQEGLIVIKPNRGVFVNRITVQDMIEVLQMREVLEGLAARLFTENASRQEIQSLVETMVPFTGDNLAESIKEYNLANVSFHSMIISGSKNARVISAVNNLYDHLAMARMQIISVTGRGRKSLFEHKNIIRAIQSKESEKVEGLVRSHIASLREDILANLEKINNFSNYRQID